MTLFYYKWPIKRNVPMLTALGNSDISIKIHWLTPLVFFSRWVIYTLTAYFDLYWLQRPSQTPYHLWCKIHQTNILSFILFSSINKARDTLETQGAPDTQRTVKVLGQPKDSKRIQKLSNNSKKFQKFQKIPKNFKRIQRNFEELKELKRIHRSSKEIHRSTRIIQKS